MIVLTRLPGAVRCHRGEPIPPAPFPLRWEGGDPRMGVWAGAKRPPKPPDPWVRGCCERPDLMIAQVLYLKGIG